MGDFPGGFADVIRHIGTLTPFGTSWMAWQNVGDFGNIASAAWPTANKAFFLPVMVPCNYRADRLYVANGTSVSGNVDMGIYDDRGTRLVSMGSTAQAGTNSIQTFDITDTLLTPGIYYLALAISNTSGTVMRMLNQSGSYSNADFLRMQGVMEMASAFALPATATFAQNTGTSLPIIGMTRRGFV